MKRNPIKWNEVIYQSNIDLNIDSECFECNSHGKDTYGYPQYRLNKKTWKLHRYIHYKNTGELPEVVMHLCDNRACINPKHLKSGTLKENMQDKVNKNRSTKGVDVKISKLIELDIKWIRMWLKIGYTQKSIANAFKVDQALISKIKYKKIWAHVA